MDECKPLAGGADGDIDIGDDSESDSDGEYVAAAAEREAAAAALPKASWPRGGPLGGGEMEREKEVRDLQQTQHKARRCRSTLSNTR
jgi:hypothetical protein